MRFETSQPFPVGSSLVEVGGIRIPEKFELLVSDDEGTGHPDVRFFFEVRNGAPECRGVHIDAPDDGHEVRCSGLAGVRIQDMLEEAIKGLLIERTRDGVTVATPSPSEGEDREAVRHVRTARARRKVIINDELLQEVAEVYRANMGRSPTQAVADHFDKSHRTATLYVQRARGRFLGEALRGKAGEGEVGER